MKPLGTPKALYWSAVTLLLWAAAASALSINPLTPFSWQNNSNVTLNFGITGSNASSCALYTNESGFGPVANETNVGNGTNGFQHNFTQGIWLWAVACADQNQTLFFSPNASIGVDWTFPTIAALNINGFNVSWGGNRMDAASGFSRYELYRNNSLIFNTTNESITSFADSNATNATWVYRLDAVSPAEIRNSTNRTIDPLFAISNLAINPATSGWFNLSWTTNTASNDSIAVNFQDGSTYSNGSATMSAQHSWALHPSAYGIINGTATSCFRTCISQAFTQTIPSTTGISLIFANATYNHQTAILDIRWTSPLGLAYVSVSSNNSGNVTMAYQTGLSNATFFEQRLVFQINDTAPEVQWNASAVDEAGVSYSTNPIALFFIPNPTPPPLPSAPNSTYVILHIGEQINASDGETLRLLDLSKGTLNPDQALTAVFETLAQNGEVKNRFSMQENTQYNSSSLAISLYGIFIGNQTSSYAQVDAEPLQGPPMPAPTPRIEVTPNPSAIANSTTAPSPLPAPAHSEVVWSGAMQAIQANIAASSSNLLSGYIISDAENIGVTFNSTYKNTGNDTEVFLIVKVKNAENQTAGIVQSEVINATSGKTIELTTQTIELSDGDYRAEAMIVTPEQKRVMDSKVLTFSVKQPKEEQATALVGIVSLLAFLAFLFVVKINHHKKNLFP